MKARVRSAPAAPAVKFSADPHDPPYWPVGLAAIEKIELLAHLAPDTFQAVHLLVDQVLREKWRTLDLYEILQVLDLEQATRPYQWKCDEPGKAGGRS